MVFLFAQVEDGAAVEAAGDEGAAHGDLHPRSAAPAVAGVTVDMLPHPGGPTTMALVGSDVEKTEEDCHG